MRMLCVCLLLCCGLAALAKPVAVDLAGLTCLPVRAVADRVGMTLAVDAATKAITLARGEKTLTVRPNHRKTGDVDLMMPAFVLDGALYVTKLDLFIHLGVDVQADQKAKTVTVPGAEPLVLPVIDFPRPAWVKDEMLARLTPGDRLAMAIANWGDWTDSEESDIPKATDYHFTVDPKHGIDLNVTAIGDDIVRIQVSLTDQVPVKELAEYVAQTGTSHGLKVTGRPPDLYRNVGETLYESETGDIVIVGYRRGELLVACSIYVETTDQCDLILVRRTAPKKWVGVW